jgi:hypothetical protein
MESFESLLKWCAQEAGVQLLEVPRSLETGFSEVEVETDGSFFGIEPDYDWKDLEDLSSAAAVRASALLSEDFQDVYFERARRIALDIRARSATTGSLFYNGKLARLKAGGVDAGRSPGDEVLTLQVGHTSYFTGLGTNSYFRGYQYRHTDLPDEPPLPEGLVWPASPLATSGAGWPAVLSESPLANPLAVHLFLYNDWEILYVRRGIRVGQQPGMWNSPINGVMEFSDQACDLVDGRPSIHLTASREAKEELGLTLDTSRIRWLGLAATLDRCQPFVIGVTRISERREEVARSALQGNGEVHHVETASRRRMLIAGRSKAVSAIATRWDIRRADVSLGTFSFTIPVPRGYPARLKSVIREKVLGRQENIGLSRRGEEWTRSGAASLLLCLVHHCGEGQIEHVLRDLRREIEGR